MHIRFNHIEGESHYVPQIERTLEEVKTKAQARLSEGAWIVEVEGIQTPALVQKKDGTTLYLTRDIAAAIDRFQRFHFEKMYYVVGGQQQLHFQLLKGVLKKMGYEWADNCEHLHFGTVLFGSEKMSTREGRVIELDGLLKEATALALVECTQKNPDLPNKEQVAEMVGVGAVVFGELSAHRTRDIEFDWKSVLALDGETGPYVQYSAVRCQSLMEKARAKGETAGGPFEYSQELAIEEEALILALARFRQSLHDVTRENEPYHLTHYLIDLAKTFNRFYYKHPVLQATDADQRRMRLNLVQATGQALMNGLNLLGISCPKEM
jgi:arginyl-tRNA synthetase